MHLQVEPDFRGRSQLRGQIESGIRRDSALAVDEFIEPGDGPSEASGKFPLRQTSGGKEFLKKHSPGMNGIGRTHNKPQ